jgi:hypothetical protein
VREVEEKAQLRIAGSAACGLLPTI